MPTFVGAKEKFASEYPNRPNPIGMRVRVRHDPKFDREFLFPNHRRDSLGEVVDYSNSHGLCFEVAHLDDPVPPLARSAWYAPEEVVDLVDEVPPIQYLDISVPLAPALRPEPDDPIPSDLTPIIRDL